MRDRLLHQTVHNGGDAKLAFLTARLGDRDAPDRLWLVATVQQARDQRLAVAGNPAQQVIDGHPVHPCRTAVPLHPLLSTVQVRGAGYRLHQVLR